MKKLLTLFITLLFLLTSITSFSACQSTETGQADITVIIGQTRHSVTTQQKNLHYVLAELLNNKEIASYEYSGSTYSVYITQIDTLTPDSANNEFITIFHSIDDSGLKSYGVDNVVIDDLTLFCSGVGASMLPIVDGATYYIFVDTY